MQYIEIEYNQELKPLEAVLSGVKQPGDFFVCGTIEMPMPRVEVEGAGTLSFPVPDAQIAAIVRRAERAPYGRGEETIVDTSVRNVWQIAPGKVKIGGKSWAANFETILSKVKAGLGCDDASVSAELYKLLVYDRGGFFLAHRDTEKTDGMFGTLVVTLPSTYRGGALRIRHAGREVTVDTNAADPSELSYVAFYADCEHEALPVREGNRICLVYNLIQKHSKGRRRILKAPEYESQITEAAAILDRFLQSTGCSGENRMASRSSVQSGRAFVFGVEGRRRGKGPSPRASGGPRAVRRASGDRPYRRVRSGRAGRRLLLQIAPESLPELRRTEMRKTTMKTRASLSPQSMTPGSTWTNGGTLMIVLWSLAAFLLPAASCSPRARSTGSLRTRSG